MNKIEYFQISESEKLDLNNPQEKFRALTWLFINGQKPFISSYILNPNNDEGLYHFLESKDYSRQKLVSEVNNFFIFFGKSESDNFLVKYLLDFDGESEIVKKNRLNQLLKGLVLFADYNWHEGASFIQIALNNRDFSFVKKGNLEELYWFHYIVWKNLKSLYDLIWDYFSIFIDKEQFSFNYFYSNKKPLQNEEKTKIDSKKDTYSSRSNILKKLLDQEYYDDHIYSKYEKKLISEGFINEDRNQWLKNAASFIRFYNYCERKEIIKEFHKTTSKGIKYMRELYNFQEGAEMDRPNKRKLRDTKKTKYQFSFLNLI